MSGAVIRIAVIAVVGIFCVQASSQPTSDVDQMPAGEFLRKAIDNELKAQSEDHSHWMYRVKSGSPGKEEEKIVVQTGQGEIDRLHDVNGQPVTPDQDKQEERRIESLVHSPRQQQKLQRAQAEDSRRTQQLLKLLPDAVIASYGLRRDGLVQILFKPNPAFHPPSHEASVFHHMAGEMWFDEQQHRLAEIEGHLVTEVKFGEGLLGHLDKGGEFHVKQAEVAPGYWEVTLMQVNMHGKVLFFKTIGVQENEIRSNFQQVPDNLTLSQAAQELQKQLARRSASRLVGNDLLPSARS